MIVSIFYIDKILSVFVIYDIVENATIIRGYLEYILSLGVAMIGK